MEKLVIAYPKIDPKDSNIIVGGHTFANIQNYNLTKDKESLDYVLRKYEEKIGLKERLSTSGPAIDLGIYCEPLIAEAYAQANKTKGYTFYSDVPLNQHNGGYIDLWKIKFDSTTMQIDRSAPKNHLLEIKTCTTSDRWSEVQKKADGVYLAQIAFYMRLMGIKEGTLIYFNAAQQSEKQPMVSLKNKETLDFTFDKKDMKNYKIYKLLLDEDKRGSLNVSKLVDPHLEPTKDYLLSSREFINHVNMNKGKSPQEMIHPLFYNPTWETETATFFQSYDENEATIASLEANMKANKETLNDSLERRKHYDTSIIKILDHMKIDTLVTTNRILRKADFKDSFDVAAFKKEHLEEYNTCQIAQRKFNAEKAAEIYPALYSNFIKQVPDNKTKVISFRNSTK